MPRRWRPQLHKDSLRKTIVNDFSGKRPAFSPLFCMAVGYAAVSLLDKTRRATPLSKSVGIIFVDEYLLFFTEILSPIGSMLISPVICSMIGIPVVFVPFAPCFLPVGFSLFTVNPVRLFCECRAG